MRGIALGMMGSILAGLALVPATARAETEPVKIGPVTYQVPTTWSRQRPSNEMRVVQYGLPLADGDQGKGELVVFYFGGQGGGVQANIERWVAMFENKAEPEKTDKFEVNGLKISTVSVAGSYKDKPAPFLPNFTLRENYRMIAAVVETPDDGPYFFRFVGPRNTIDAQAASFIAMLKSATIK